MILFSFHGSKGIKRRGNAVTISIKGWPVRGRMGGKAAVGWSGCKGTRGKEGEQKEHLDWRL